jgi:phosphocarrier protein HPr
MERDVQILNKLGLHARPAAEFVRAARAFRASVVLRKDGEHFSASSILEILMANLGCGTSVTIIADGPDEETALEHLCSLLEKFRRDEEC